MKLYNPEKCLVFIGVVFPFSLTTAQLSSICAVSAPFSREKVHSPWTQGALTLHTVRTEIELIWRH